MVLKQAMIAVRPHTRDRIFQYKRAGVSYDKVISEMIDAYEEKIERLRSHSAPTCETGMINHSEEEVIS